MKIDLHVHSKYSKRPSQWVLQKLGARECYTEPLALYRTAKDKGMSAVTITDHNTINGCLEIAHLPDTFISEEVTTYFPEDGCKVHVLVYQINEAQHADIQKARTDIFDLVPYLHQEGITHSLAHPIWSVNNRLSLAHFEQLLLLFKNFELNGARDARLNDWLKIILSILSPGDLEKMMAAHQVTPPFAAPWEKNFTGGSDDLSSINIARMFTVVDMAPNLREFFQGLQQGKAEVRGQASTPLTLAYNIYSIAYQFYKNKYDLSPKSYSNIFGHIFERILASPPEPPKNYPKRYAISNKIRSMIKWAPKDDSIISLVTNEVAKISGAELNAGTENKWFEIINMVSVNILKQVNKSFRKALKGAHFIDLVNSVTSTGLVYLGLSPYFAAYTSFAGDRQLGQEIVNRFLEAKHDRSLGPGSIKLAHFTDTFYEINGVGLTLQRQVEAAVNADKHYTIIACDQTGRPSRPGVKNFMPLGVFQLPEYKEQKLFHPPVLEILDYCYKNNFTHFMAATPGPMGLTALALARMLHRPIWGTYHTALPQYAQYLVDDPTMVELMWKYIIWFYQQMDLVYVPSRSTARELEEKGIDPGRMKVYPRGVDLARFHPAKRNGVLENIGDSPEGLKLLYVGRVSKEKNLELLGRVFRKLAQAQEHLHLVVVGDGPYLEEMRRELADTPCHFTGYLEGEDLAAVFASCDLFLFPSTTDTFGNVVLEAQASGIPVVITDSGGPQENVIPGKTGLIVPAQDEAAFFGAVAELINHPQRLKEMGRAARDYMQDRSFENAFLQSWRMFEERAVA
jgi:glycosyltransferase involved in cell wall biosynthesis